MKIKKIKKIKKITTFVILLTLTLALVLLLSSSSSSKTTYLATEFNTSSTTSNDNDNSNDNSNYNDNSINLPHSSSAYHNKHRNKVKVTIANNRKRINNNSNICNYCSTCLCGVNKVIPNVTVIAPILDISVQYCSIQSVNESFAFNFTICNQNAIGFLSSLLINTTFNTSISSVSLLSSGYTCANQANTLSCNSSLSIPATKCISLRVDLSFVSNYSVSYQSQLFAFFTAYSLNLNVAVSSNISIGNATCDSCYTCNQYVNGLVNSVNNQPIDILVNNIGLNGGSTSLSVTSSIMYNSITASTGATLNSPIQIIPIPDGVALPYLNHALAQYSQCACDVTINVTDSVVLNISPNVITCISPFPQDQSYRNISFNFDGLGNPYSVFIIKYVFIQHISLSENSMNLINKADACNIYWITPNVLDIHFKSLTNFVNIYGNFITKGSVYFNQNNTENTNINMIGKIMAIDFYIYNTKVFIKSCTCNTGFSRLNVASHLSGSSLDNDGNRITTIAKNS